MGWTGEMMLDIEKPIKIYSRKLDWDNDLSYEVVGINLTESKKNVEGVSIAFVIMKYNEKT